MLSWRCWVYSGRRVVALGVLVMLSGFLRVPGIDGASPEGKKRGQPNSYTIQELNKSGLNFGTYAVEGYVMKMVLCASCLDKALCAPCAPEHMIISEEKLLLEKRLLTDRELIVFIENQERLQIGVRYRFLIQMLDVRTMNQKAFNAKLVYAELLS